MGGWGKVRAPTLLRLLDAMGCGSSVVGRTFAAVVPRIRNANRASPDVAEAVRKWADENGMKETPLDCFEVVSVSNREIADEVFNGDTTNARKGVKKLLEYRVIERVRQGTKGHSSVYMVFHNGDMRGSSDPLNANQKGVDMDEYGGREPVIGGSPEAVTCGVVPYPESSRCVYPEGPCVAAAAKAAPPAPETPSRPASKGIEGAEKEGGKVRVKAYVIADPKHAESRTCPECEGPLEEGVLPGIWLCRRCEKAVRVS